MKNFILKNKKILGALCICLAIGGITMSFQNNDYGPLQQYDSLAEIPDSIPDGYHEQNKMTMKEYDELMSNLNAEMKKVKEELSKINVEKMSSEIKESLEKINTDQVKMAIDKAMKEVDFAAIEKEVRKAMSAVEWSKLSEEVKNSLDKAKAEVERIDMKEINRELAEAKKEIERSKSELSKIDVDKIMAEAKEGIKKAGESLKKQKAMFNEMEKDGLINQREGFSIEYKDGELYINNKKQPASVKDKYRSYFDSKGYKITIDKE